MNRRIALLLMALSHIPYLIAEESKPVEASQSKPVIVACYYFPNCHPGDARNQEFKGAGWSEWELVKEAKPRFESHHQPNVPLWGYTDESDPKQMAQKIAAAADHGIDAFIFDWYWFDDGPFLERGLDNGFLKATNNDRIKFSLMWANHDWIDIHPYKKGSKRKVLYPGKIKKKTFEKVCEHVINKYFKHPSYWKIDSKPYFSIYELNKLMESFSSVEATRKALLATKRRLEKDQGPPILTINCWNEWTEGSYLEPDTRNKMTYLKAVKKVFGNTPDNWPRK